MVYGRPPGAGPGETVGDVILGVMETSCVTRFDLASYIGDQWFRRIIPNMVSIESVQVARGEPGAYVQPLETLVAPQPCGTHTGFRYGDPTTYTPDTFPVVSDATEFLVSIIRGVDTNVRPVSEDTPRPTFSGLAICRAFGVIDRS